MTVFTAASWIWDGTDPSHVERHNLRARRTFDLSQQQLCRINSGAEAWLRIAAQTVYQVWLNGTCVGNGPAKAPAGIHYADAYALGEFASALVAGENVLDVLVYTAGTGTMTNLHSPAGLIFELVLPGEAAQHSALPAGSPQEGVGINATAAEGPSNSIIIASDTQTLVCADPQRSRATVRRWLLHCLEDVDATATHYSWKPARIVEKTATVLPRPVALPARQALYPQRMLAADTVRTPNFGVSFRIKLYLVDAIEQRRNNLYYTTAAIVSDLHSATQQCVEFLPASGEILWFLNGERLVQSSGWSRWGSINPDNVESSGTLQTSISVTLQAGANRLVGIHHRRSHFEEVHLSAFCASDLRACNPFGKGGFQVIRLQRQLLDGIDEANALPEALARAIESAPLVAMDPADTICDGNAQDTLVNSRVTADSSGLAPQEDASRFILAGAAAGHASRVVLDLGAIQNGWLSFCVRGTAGSTLTFSFFESLNPGAPLEIVWPGPCQNALRYHLRQGWQQFDSLLAYGVRYIAIQHEGPHAAELRNVCIVSNYCGNLPRVAVRTGDLLLDEVHSICLQTLRAATDDTLTDCPTYEAVNWNFDNRLGTLASIVSYANTDILRNTIEPYAMDPVYPGLVRSHAPSAWENRIPVFSFHWILLCRDFYRYTGEADFLLRVFPQIARGLEEALGMVDPALDLMRWPNTADTWHIIDWSRGRDDNHEIVSTEQALLVACIDAVLELHAALPETEGGRGDYSVSHLPAWRERLLAAIDRHLWDEQRDAYADSLHGDGQRSAVSSQVSNAALALYGAGSGAWRGRLHARLNRSDASLLPYGSPMGLFYILEFLDQCNDAESIFRIIRKNWTTMLLAGDKTTWEHFPEFSGHPALPTRSRCHPFAAYILKYYAKYLFGLRGYAAGSQEITLQPQPPQGLNEFHGCMPLAGGWLRVSWRKTADGSIDVTASASSGIRVVNACGEAIARSVASSQAPAQDSPPCARHRPTP